MRCKGLVCNLWVENPTGYLNQLLKSGTIFLMPKTALMLYALLTPCPLCVTHSSTLFITADSCTLCATYS